MLQHRLRDSGRTADAHPALPMGRRGATQALSVYVHIPFCSAICNYCNFNRGLFDGGLKDRYVRALRAAAGQ